MAMFNCRVSGVLLNDKKETLLIKRSKSYITDNREADEFIKWEFCGGGLDYDETPGEAIEREYEEEVGVKVSAVEIFSSRVGVRGDVPLLNLSYVCKYVSGDIKLTDEHIDFKWVPVEDLNKYDLGQYTNIDKESFIKFYAAK